MSTTASKSSRRATTKAQHRVAIGGGVVPVASGEPAAAGRLGKAQHAAALLLQDAPAGELDVVLAATDRSGRQTLDGALWGAAPDRGEVDAGVLANLRKQFAGRAALEQASVSRAEAAGLLGTSEQAVTGALAAGRLLGFKRGRRWLIPAWQLDPEAERGVLAGLGELAAAFPGGVVALSRWAVRPHPDLGGCAPRDALANGELEAVVGLARTVTAAGW